jgi:hypothetical protein
MIRAGEDGPVKIGTATNATHRIDSLKAASYLRLHVVRLIEGGRREEQALHHEFRHLRIKGEWFTYDPRMLDIDPTTIPLAPPRPKPGSPRTPRPCAVHEPLHIPKTASPSVKFSLYLQAIGWSRRELAERLGCDPVLAWRWARGKAAIPKSIARWLEALANDHNANLPPSDWRKR